VTPRVETLGRLFDARRQSEEWKAFQVQTRGSYERVVDPTNGSVARVRAKPLIEFSPAFVVGLRDAIAQRRKRGMANYAIKILRLAFA
jgi:hypothetical protein